ncbi:MAG: hypothetical protein C0397_12005 [Odoribacter sp.]|nr:hypothetical protein [Odoribacter sp.]
MGKKINPSAGNPSSRKNLFSDVTESVVKKEVTQKRLASDWIYKKSRTSIKDDIKSIYSNVQKMSV